MSKRLVAYFSASGITAKVAENLADAIGADIFEIQPDVPYTKADLNWMDKKARSTIEMSDPTSRPAIAAKRDNMDEYDTIFVGFPIWWYVAPTIINTFLESYDLKGKTIVPFATSGGSSMGKTNEKLAPSCPGAKLLHGKVFTTLCEHTLDNAYLAHPDLRGAIVHSDRGRQYTSETYRQALSKYGIIQSMNSDGGRCHDNARCESMWARMKSELLYDRYNTESLTTDELRVRSRACLTAPTSGRATRTS